MPTTLILHERIGRLARHLRPETLAGDFRVVETRSEVELRVALRASACPIAVVDFRDRPAPPLRELAESRAIAPASLLLALIPDSSVHLIPIAMESGASAVLPTSSTPPEIISLIDRWLGLSNSRNDSAGWATDRVPRPQPWELLLADVARTFDSPD